MEKEMEKETQISEHSKRIPLFDNLRGVLIWTIPISHFLRVGGSFHHSSLSGVLYITINVFVMQAFIFLSGYMSKHPDKARKTAFKTFLFPYILLVPFFYVVRHMVYGASHLSFIDPPQALWYLLVLFYYRVFLKDMVRTKWILLISAFLYFAAGQLDFMGERLALGRAFSFLIFFIIGYYVKEEHIKAVLKIRKSICIILAVLLVYVSYILAYKSDISVEFYLLREAGAKMGIPWYTDIMMRLLVFMLSVGWTVVLINLLPKCENYLTYVGRNTMPIYILHLILRQYFKAIGGFYTGNNVVYCGLVFIMASACVIVLSDPSVVFYYNKVMDKTYDYTVGWIMNKFKNKKTIKI